MLWYVLAGIIAIGLGIAYFMTERDLYGSIVLFVVSGVIAIAIAFVINLVIWGFYGRYVTQYNPEVQHSKIELKAFGDNLSSSGSFFLGTGNVDTSSHYYFYKVRKDGSYVMAHVPTHNASIIEEDRTNAILYVFSSTQPSGWKILYYSFEETVYRYEFHVPKNTVKTDFKADLN